MCLEIIRPQTICMLPFTYVWIKYTHVSFYNLIFKKNWNSKLWFCTCNSFKYVAWKIVIEECKFLKSKWFLKEKLQHLSNILNSWYFTLYLKSVAEAIFEVCLPIKLVVCYYYIQCVER